MDLLAQCQKWTEEEEYQKIIDTLENISEKERTPELDSELARAYNNIAEPEEKEYFYKALDLLLPHEEYFENDHRWNFRTAYAYFYLDKEWRALYYFKKALDARPGDEDTLAFIEECRNSISLPYFTENFKQRVVKAWQLFAENEGKIRDFIDKKDEDKSRELIALCSDILNTAFKGVSFEIGFNGEKYDLILSPEGDAVNIFPIIYFAKYAPENVIKNWNIIVGRKPVAGCGFKTEDVDITAEDVKVWVEKTGEEQNIKASLKVYCEKLLPLLQKEENKVWWVLTTYTDQILGEIAHMRYIESYDVLESPADGSFITLDKLPEKLIEMGIDINIDADTYIESCYLGYSLNPSEDEDADIRFDVMAGSTRCPAIINDYLNNESEYIDELLDNGITAGFFFFPLNNLVDENSSNCSKIFEFRDKVENEMILRAGSDAVTLLGGATGRDCGYIDFIAWDLKCVLDAGAEIFSKGEVDWAGFQLFHRDAKPVKLYEKTDKKPVIEKRKNR